MSRMSWSEIPGADLLDYFEAQYYAQLPLGGLRRIVNRYRGSVAQALRRTRQIARRIPGLT
jgi:hypothetical protein